MGVIRSCIRGALCLLGLHAALAWAQPGERVHTVQRKETAFGIARQYGVDLNALFELNRWAEQGIRKGDVLRIPAPVLTPVSAPDSAPVDSVPSPSRAATGPIGSTGGGEFPTLDSVPDHGGGASAEIPRKRPVPPTWTWDTLNVAVFLPFSAGEDSLARQALRLREIALDCAAGVRLALDSGRWNGGAPVEVRFFDTGLDTAGVMKCNAFMLDSLDFDVDVALGPLRRPAFNEVRSWKRMEGAVHLVLTDLGASMAQNAPGVLYPYSQVDSRMALLAQRVAEEHPGERVMMLASGDIRNLEAEDAFRAGWAAAEVDSTTALVEVEVSSRGLGSLRDSLSDVRRNVLVVPGGKASRSFAGVLQTEIQLGDTMDFVLYADGSWRDFEFLDPGLMGRVGLTVVDGGGTPVDSVAGVPSGVGQRAELWRRLSILRGGPVGDYGVLAHDLLREALIWTAGQGPHWTGRLGQGELLVRPGDAECLLHRFAWSASLDSGSGLINRYARILHLDGLQWVENGRPAPPVLMESQMMPHD